MASVKEWYLLSMTYHHNNPMPSWDWNVQAKSEDELILAGYKTLIQALVHDDAVIPDLTPILSQEELAIIVYENEYGEDDFTEIVLWNTKDEHDGTANRGAGYGTTVNETSKGANVWFEYTKRENTKKHLSRAAVAYKDHLDKLPKDLLQAMVQMLDAKVKA